MSSKLENDAKLNTNQDKPLKRAPSDFEDDEEDIGDIDENMDMDGGVKQMKGRY